ncbi:RagB/SusD family nutrient uptake outer membrane protein [Sphingobacterium yanglingense]|uniref:Putative outer membrane starch-binding protein n=1 Tax=Sphingobacterium yanglingense TaxID=1437280 RepID=A0A4R6WDU7_9SPHI|nr:RagB/SusD family nutrient uptake outer membrane protein [Sphingobacterium yanglingense]TDQ75993.1 putative outer membrane starch-binding protein [Sphingobacterium yanglingense]
MKKIFCTTILSILLLVLGSCEKFLDTKPQDFLSNSNYFKTEDHLNSFLNGVYDVLGSTRLYGSQLLILQNTQADEGFYFGALPVGLETYAFTESYNLLENFWGTLYNGVLRANVLLANVNNNEAIDQGFRDRIRGEALFLRAYYYFMLVQNFENVPLILEPTKDAETIDIPASSAKEIYEKILADMKEAEILVDPIQTIGNAGRVSKSAVRGILARVCLHMSGQPVGADKYEEARFWAKQIIDDASAAHELNNDYRDIFIKYARDEYDLKESIWEVEFWGNNSDGRLEAGYVGSFLGIRNQSSTNGIGYSFGRISATANLYRSYSSYDLRRDWNIAPFTYNVTTGAKVAAVTFPTPAQQYLRSSAKYRREYEVVRPQATQLTPINFPLLRFADVLLMFAEADAHVNGGIPSPQSIEYVNQVRRRAYGKFLNGKGNVSESIKEIKVINGGAGYNTGSKIAVVNGGGVAATATLTVQNGVIKSVTITNPGERYTTLPTITFSGSGSGAVLEPVLTRIEDADLELSQTLDRDSFLKVMQEERSRELCFEALRRYDLIRWGILVKNMKIILGQMNSELTNITYQNASFMNITDKHVVYPIPLREFQLNRALEQHPLWR